MPLIPGSQYECFPCLERPGFIAVRPTDGSNKGGIVARVTAIEMTDCSFFVSEAGRQQAIREQRQNIHAVVRGRFVAACVEEPPTEQLIQRHIAVLSSGDDISYHPLRSRHFLNRETGLPVFSARTVVVVGRYIAARP